MNEGCEPGKCEGHVEGEDLDVGAHINEIAKEVGANRYFSISLSETTPEQRAKMISLAQSFDVGFSVYLEDPIKGEVEVDVEVLDETAS